MATSVVTPVAGFVATAPDTVTRPAPISSLACSRERARRRRTSSASRRRRRGGTCRPRSGRLVGLAVEGPPQPLVGTLEDGDLLLDRQAGGGLHLVEDGVDR